MYRRAPMPPTYPPSRLRQRPAAATAANQVHNRTKRCSSLREKIVLPEANFWNRYRDLEEVATEAVPDALVEILETFAAAHQKHIYLFQRFRSTILRNLDKFDAPALASICHSFVVVGFLREEFVVALVPRIVETAHLCSASDLCNLLDAYASLRSSHPDLLQKVTAETFRLLHRFTVSELATHISSFARLNAHSHRLFSQVANRLLELDRALCRYEKKVQNLFASTTNTNITTTTINSNNNSGEDDVTQDINAMKGSLLEEAAKSVNCVGPLEFTARDLTLAAYAFAKLGLYIEDIFELISRRGSLVARDFTAHQIQMVAVAYHRANLRDLVFLGRLSQQAQRRMAQFNAESIALLMRTYALFGIRDLSLFTRIVAQLPRLILTFRPLDIATTLNAFAKLDICSCALLAVAFPHVLAEQAKFSSADLQSVLHACARLGVVHPMFLEMLVNRCDPSQLNICQIATLLTDLATLAYFEFPFILAAFAEALYSARFTLSPPIVCQLLTAAIHLKIDSTLEGEKMFNLLMAEAQRELKSKKPYKIINPTNAHAQLQSPLPMGAILASLAYALCCWNSNNIDQDIYWGESTLLHPAELLRPALDKLEDNNIYNNNDTNNNRLSSQVVHETLSKLNLAVSAVKARDDVTFKAWDEIAFLSQYKLSWASLTGEVVRGAEKETFLGLQDIACAFIRRFELTGGIVIYYNLSPEELEDDVVQTPIKVKAKGRSCGGDNFSANSSNGEPPLLYNSNLLSTASAKEYVAVVKCLEEDCPLGQSPWHCFLSLPLRSVSAPEDYDSSSRSSSDGIYRRTQSDMYSGGGCRSASIDSSDDFRDDSSNDDEEEDDDNHCYKSSESPSNFPLRNDFYRFLEPMEGPKLIVFWTSPLHYIHNKAIVDELKLNELPSDDTTDEDMLHRAVHLYLKLQYTPAAQMQWKLIIDVFPTGWQRIVIPSYCWTVCRSTHAQENFLLLLLNSPALLQYGMGSGNMAYCPYCPK